MAEIRMAVSSVRLLAVIALVLALIAAVAAVVGVVAVGSQISDLSARVSALQDEQAQIRQQAQSAPSGDVDGQAGEAGQNDSESAQSTVAQLPAAPALPSEVPIPAGLDETGAVLVGDLDASNVVEVYLDYQCPYCQRWESEIGAQLTERALQPDSDLLVKHYVLAFLGETSPTLDPPGASARAGSAALCVVEGDGPQAFTAFSEAVYASADPNEPATQFSTAALSELASSLGASAGTVECINDERHVPFVALGTQSGFGRGVQGTPTVVVNGRTVESSFGDQELLGLTLG